jgi:hypothetical protein
LEAGYLPSGKKYRPTGEPSVEKIVDYLRQSRNIIPNFPLAKLRGILIEDVTHYLSTDTGNAPRFSRAFIPE